MSLRGLEATIARAAREVAEAEAILIGAGAGMGVDSGLPDFRGDEGFWRAYPPLSKLGVSFVEMANPAWFERDPTLAWGFYGHRLSLYRRTWPHAGFEVLRRWAGDKPGGAFVFTSNVDGQFQRAGFDGGDVYECHGSIHHLQCVSACEHRIWEAEGVEVPVDLETLRVGDDALPRCAACGALARPNVLMFGDWRWLAVRAEAQARRLDAWLAAQSGRRVAVIECGAGTALPTVRRTCERAARTFGVRLIRVNPREAHGPAGTLSLAAGACDALNAIADAL